VTPAAGADELSLLTAAQAGDRRALAELVTAYLPLVYTIARRGLGCTPEVDDVVQETMLRALRELRSLRAPESFRPWLMTIATRQVSTFLRRRQAVCERTLALDDVVDTPSADAEELALIRLELSVQRLQVTRASRWLDPDDGLPLALWWLESIGRLTRTELASTLEKSVAHAGVCVQRARGRLEAGRSIVAALDTEPRCIALVETLEGWDGAPGPLWRKRILRHVRSCPTCRHASARLLPAERLFDYLMLIPDFCYPERRSKSRRGYIPHFGKYTNSSIVVY
jgi:RNA polymerase sigma factor (sigma-70 family)